MRVGVWERDEGISAAVRAALAGYGAEVSAGRHPAELAAVPLELLVISPGAVGWAGAGAVHCRTVLLPGAAGPLARTLQAGQAVSYGTSPRDTLTFSSLSPPCLALQRELVTLDGTCREPQELPLPPQPGTDPRTLLAWAGVLLLLGTAPEDLPPLL